MTKQTALVTGASGGIGYELAEILAAKGIDLVLVARNGQKMKEIRKKFESLYGSGVRIIEKDLSIPGSAAEVWEEISGQRTEISYLVNNAGFGDIAMFAECDWSKQERMINLNILALTHLTRLVLPGMIARGYGRILNVASTASFQPGPTMSVYFASKAFVLSFSEALGNEVKDKGITVTALCPGSTRSGFQAAALGEGRTPRDRNMPSARSVAEYGYRSMMRGRAVAIPGFLNAFMVFCVRFMPRSLVVKAARMIQVSKL